MRVLHVTLSFDRGGRREAIQSLAEGLAALGVVSDLCCLDEIGDGAKSALSGFEHVLALRRRDPRDRAARAQLAAFLAEIGVDLVHTHDAASQYACAMAMRWAHPPLLMTYHRSRDFESARLRDRVRNALCGLRTAAIVVGSEARRRHYLDRNLVAARKLRYIPFGIDLARFKADPAQHAGLRRQLGLPSHAQLVGAVGHFGPEKGIDLALAAFQRWWRRQADPGVHLLVIGEGEAERAAWLRDQVAPECAAQVRFVGFQPAVERWMQGLDLFLHGARLEAFGLVLVEAMACGVPVVACAVGGIPELVVHGEGGLLAPPGDVAALADGIGQLLGDELRRRACANAAAARARARFGRERYASEHHALYRTLAAES